MLDAERILRTLLDEVLVKHNYHQHQVDVKAITSGGANYTSVLYTIKATAPKCEDLKLFAKVAIVGEKMRSRMNADLMYLTEKFIYTQLVEIYDSIQDKYKIPEELRFCFPKFYGCNGNRGEETVILEDLVSAGYGMYSRLVSLDWEHAASSIEVLARFHALSFAYQKNYPEQFDEVVKKMTINVDDISDDESMKETWMKMIRSAVEVVKDEHKEKLVKFFSADISKEDFYQFRKPLSRPVLSHGDYRPSNLMYRRKNGVLETIAVDYQTVHAGCPVSDLFYFLFTGSDEEFRRNHYLRLLDHYYNHLAKVLAVMQIDVNEVYPRETYESELKKMLPYALRMTVAILPIVTVDAEEAPQVAGDADISQFALKPNQLFAERFRGVVSDCVRWGVL